MDREKVAVYYWKPLDLWKAWPCAWSLNHSPQPVFGVGCEDWVAEAVGVHWLSVIILVLSRRLRIEIHIVPAVYHQPAISGRALPQIMASCLPPARLCVVSEMVLTL